MGGEVIQYFRIGEVSRRLCISDDTIRRYEVKGIIQPLRNQFGVRFFTEEDIKTIKEFMEPKCSNQ